MTNSHISWYGKLPANWKIQRIQWHMQEINQINNPIKTKQILSLTNKLGVVPYEEKGNQGNVAKQDLSQYKIAYPNTIVANSMNILIGSVGISNYYGCVSPVYYVFKPNEGENLHYLNYLFQLTEFQKYLRNFSNGILEIRLRLSSDDILKRSIPYPPLDIQSKISNLLDKKILKLDALIDNEQKQIERLKAYKQSLISEIVTKGLDPNVPMKDSGVEWVGKIPKQWKIGRIKNIAWLKGRIGWDGLKSSEFKEDGPYLITGTDFKDGEIDWATCVHISEERFMQDELLHVKENDLLITKDGTIGKLAIVKEVPGKVSLNSGVMIIRSLEKKEYLEKFLYYILESNVFFLWYQLSQNGNSTIKHLYQEQFYNFYLPFPSIEEQKKISDFLDCKCKKINLILKNHNDVIDKLHQYKKSLIYEYVTGQKEVK